MVTLALDLGDHTGWAVGEETPTESGEKNFAPGRGSSPGVRYVWFSSWLETTIKQYNVHHVVYEMPHMRGSHATQRLFGYVGQIERVCAAFRRTGGQSVEYEAVHTATLKKHATGRGNADKALMVAAAEDRFGNITEIQSDNHADALLLWDYAKHRME